MKSKEPNLLGFAGASIDTSILFDHCPHLHYALASHLLIHDRHSFDGEHLHHTRGSVIINLLTILISRSVTCINKWALPICPLINKLSNRDGSAGNLYNLIHSSSGNGGCPAAALVRFSAFYPLALCPNHLKQGLGIPKDDTRFACQAAILVCSRPSCR